MDLWAIHLPIPFILAVVATLGYLFGRRTHAADSEASARSRRELRRAQLVAAELEKIAWELRKSLAQHNASVARFKDRVGKLSEQSQQGAWKELCREAEEILKPTLRLAAQISNAHEEIRQQSANLMTFTEVRTDPLTGVNNRRGLDDALTAQFAMMNRYDMRFSLAMFDIDHFKRVNDQEGHLCGDRMLQKMARMLDEIRPRDRRRRPLRRRRVRGCHAGDGPCRGRLLRRAAAQQDRKGTADHRQRRALPRPSTATRRTRSWPAPTPPSTRRRRPAATASSATTATSSRRWPPRRRSPARKGGRTRLPLLALADRRHVARGQSHFRRPRPTNAARRCRAVPAKIGTVPQLLLRRP